MKEAEVRSGGELSGGAGGRPASVYALMAALAFQGLSGLTGGSGLLYDPSGETLRIPLEWLAGSPFSDYTVPGLVLLTVLGVGPLVAVYGVWVRRRWAWTASVAVGAALSAWLAIEILVIGYQPEPPLQLIYGVVATVVILTALFPEVRADLGRAGGRP